MSNWNRNNEDRNNRYGESYNYNEDYNYNFLERDKEMEIIKLRQKNKKKVFVIIYLILGIFSSLMIFCIWFYKSKNVDPSDIASSTIDKDINTKVDLNSNNSETKPTSKLTSEEVYKKCSKSVVGIVVVKQGFDFFYGPVKNKGQGSGVVISSDGYILTNAHVVDGVDEMQVSFIDNTQKYFKAKLIGKDKNNDLAVIKVEREGLTPAIFGDSSQLAVGQKVCAIGSPYGLENTMTSGEISSLDRQINDDETKYIQTNAAINPGNSGGGMFDEYGKLVGIPSAKLAQAENIGFAIPSNTAKEVADRLIKKGPMTHKERIWDRN